MKPKDFKSPFRWHNRAPCIHSTTLFVPEYYFAHDQFIMPSFEDPSLFGRQAPTFIEYCSGNGDWVVEQARAHPEWNWIAVEKRFDRVRKIWSKRENLKLKNLLIVSGEAHTFSTYYLKSSCLAGIYINFPDPWPKGKHAKHRLFHPPFIQELARTTGKEGKVLMVTDDPLWAQRTTKAFQESSAFQDPLYATEHPGYGNSFFEILFRSQGKTIHYLTFEKK